MIDVRDEDDYYELLQISPRADLETIQRVHRLLAARFHPDNWRTADADRFLALNRAYEVLSDPQRRAQYDAERQVRESRPLPIFELEDFVYGFESEMNRRLGVLALLYQRRRSSPETPGVSVLDLERRMAFPREFFSFTLWYLRSKRLVEMSESSDYQLTPIGMDYLEENAAQNQVIRKLLGVGSLTGSDRSDKPVVMASALCESRPPADQLRTDERFRRVA